MEFTKVDKHAHSHGHTHEHKHAHEHEHPHTRMKENPTAIRTGMSMCTTMAMNIRTIIRMARKRQDTATIIPVSTGNTSMSTRSTRKKITPIATTSSQNLK
jgi:ABC-type Zn2+ transport system substrate-binding protein/surface adhesin